MTKFSIGDHVRIIASPCRWFDQVGTVTSVTEGQHFALRIEGVESGPLWFHPDELILAENRAEGAA